METETKYSQELADVFTQNYTEFAKYTIQKRAIPALEDGCKSIHRRIIWSMYMDKNTHDKNRKKSNTAVGQAMAYSPHGNTSIYGAIVRFANDSVNIPLIDGKGSFSSHTSRDVGAASDRYTEVRLAPIAQEFLKNIDKNIAGMKNNYDDSRLEPVLLPTTFPTVLCNPTLGIATGIASNICAFPLPDVIDNTINVLEGKAPNLMVPDFPTGGELIYDEAVLKQIEETGLGKLVVRSKYHYENNSIVITEIPYTTTREAIIEKILKLVKDGVITEIVDINDHTGKNGLKITIDVKKNCDKDKLMLKLFKKTALQDTFSCNFYVLDNGFPRVLGTKQIIEKWLEFRKPCIVNTINYDIKEKEEKLHLLLGLKNVLLDVDNAVNIIRFSKTPKEDLMEKFTLDEEQAGHILEIKLKNINEDYILKQIKDIDDLIAEVESLKKNVNDKNYIANVIKQELLRVKKTYPYVRKTTIIDKKEEVLEKDAFVEEYNCYITLTEKGYLKKTKLASDNHKMKDGDRVLQQLSCTNKMNILLFSDKGNLYTIKNYENDLVAPSAMGSYLPTILKMDNDENIIYIVPTLDYKGDMLFGFENGKVAKVSLESYNTTRSKLLNAYNMDSKLIHISLAEDKLMVAKSSIDKVLIFFNSSINSKNSRISQGVAVLKSKNDSYMKSLTYLPDGSQQDVVNYYLGKINAVGNYLKKEHNGML